MAQPDHRETPPTSARRHFEDRYEFFDDVLGQVFLNQLERDCIDSPEFRRLFRISQLGSVHLLYHTANHTRGIHSIGACAKAKALVERLNHNNPKVADERRIARERGLGRFPPENIPTITWAERCLISLGGLLHDIPRSAFPRHRKEDPPL